MYIPEQSSPVGKYNRPGMDNHHTVKKEGVLTHFFLLLITPTHVHLFELKKTNQNFGWFLHNNEIHK